MYLLSRKDNSYRMKRFPRFIPSCLGMTVRDVRGKKEGGFEMFVTLPYATSLFEYIGLVSIENSKCRPLFRGLSWLIYSLSWPLSRVVGKMVMRDHESSYTRSCDSYPVWGGAFECRRFLLFMRLQCLSMLIGPWTRISLEVGSRASNLGPSLGPTCLEDFRAQFV